MRDVFVVGVGMTRIGKHPERSGHDLGAEALRDALVDAQLPWQRVQNLVVGHTDSGGHTALNLLHEFPWTGIPVHTVSSQSATGTQAFVNAYLSVATGQVDVAAAVGLERSLSGGIARQLMQQERRNLVEASGYTPLTVFGLLKTRRMYEYGDSEEAFAGVVVKNYANGAHNPKAQRQRFVTVEEVLASPMLAPPMRLLEACPVGDGAAAVLVASRDAAGPAASRAVKVAASVALSDQYHSRARFGVDYDNSTRKAAAIAYEAASIGPEDVDVIETHDAFAVEELIYCEELGLCPRGDAAKLIADGTTRIGGRVAVSPSGGLLARGHPMGPTGTAQIVEIVGQLRGEADGRQQPNAKVGLAHMLGGQGMWFVNIFTR